MKMHLKNVRALAFLLLTVVVSFAFSACGKSDGKQSAVQKNTVSNHANANIPKEEVYQFNYKRPLHSQTDSIITVDGKLDEDVWKNQKYIEWKSIDNKKRKATTVFTEKGLYIGAFAEDDTVIYNGRHAVGNNDEFWLRIIKEDEVNFRDSDRHHPQRQFVVQVDAKDSLSMSEHKYDAAQYIDGEIGENKAKSFSIEVFMGWSELGYTKEELTKNGYPDAVKIYIEYRSVGVSWSYPGFVDNYRYSTYYTYNCNGVVQIDKSPYVGNAVDGECATVDWKVDDKNKTAISTVNGGRTIFLKQDDSGNKISKATSFMLSTKVELQNGAEGYAWTGLLSYGGNTNILIYTMYGDTLLNGDSLIVGSTRAACGNQWTGDKSVGKTVSTSYTGNSAVLKMYKSGPYFYYFVNDAYVGMEYIEQQKGEVQVGFYSGLISKFSNWHFVNYDGKEDALQKELHKKLYFVTTEVSGGGTLSTDVSVVNKGDEIVITASPNSGSVLTSLKVNGKEMLNQYLSNVKNGSWTYRINSDVNIKAIFELLSKESLVDVKISAINRKTGESMPNATYAITSSDSRMVYTGKTNENGLVVLQLPKAGTYKVGKNQWKISGDYTLYVEKDKLTTATGKLVIPKTCEKSLRVTVELEQSWNFVAWPANNKLDNWKYDDTNDTVIIEDDWAGAIIPDADNLKNFRASVTFGAIKNDGGQVGFEFCQSDAESSKSSIFVSVARFGSKYVLRINRYQHETIITLKSNIVIDNNNPCELRLQRVNGIYTVWLNGKNAAVLDENKTYNAQGSEIKSGMLNFGSTNGIRLKELITSKHNQLRFCAPMAGGVILYNWSFDQI